MPYASHLDGWLTELDLRGARNLHTFHSHLQGGEGGLLNNQAFSRLKNAYFNYHAHCCQLKRSNYSFYDLPNRLKRNTGSSSLVRAVFQRIYDHFFGGRLPSENADVAPDYHELKRRYTRQTSFSGDSPIVDAAPSCFNYTDLNIVLFPEDNDPALKFDSGSGEEVVDGSRDLPEGWYFHENSTDLICTDDAVVNITAYYVNRTCRNDENLSSISTTPSRTSSAVRPTISSTQAFDKPSTSLPESIAMATISATPTSASVATATIHTHILSIALTPTPTPEGVDPTALDETCLIEVFCTLRSAPPPTVTMDPVTEEPTLPSCECGDDFICKVCRDTGCEAAQICNKFRDICDGSCHQQRRKRSQAASVSHEEKRARQRRDTSAVLDVLPDGWFYPNPKDTSLACVPIAEYNDTNVPVTIASELSTLSTTSPGTSDQQPTEEPRTTCAAAFLPETLPAVREFSTSCTPFEDAFNPCEDLLGSDHVLRSFIWIVIILSLFGNSLVIIVFLGYAVFMRRTKMELFVVHFFYFNLAIADFLMGVYLFTIAVQDLRTLGNFSMFDVVWRTDGGCDFAGVCAITSTMVSVYVLLVITLERLYTFSRALRKSHTSKTTAVILMAFGWAFGVVVGILPVVTDNVSDYTKVAICLPFDVSSPLALFYVLFLLVFTGLAFIAIAVSYVIIFYQVFCRQKATISSSGDRKRWKTELIVALRMGTLVFTNFVCWFPIALLGISAAVGHSLVDNIIFAKWVMVFIFPINACLNPILYSVLSKVFRDNLVLIVGKCGVCRSKVSQIQRHRAGYTPSATSVSSRHQVSHEAGPFPDVSRGTIIERFRNFSITSTSNLLSMGRRSSMMSQSSSEEHYQIELMREQRRRSSEYSSASSEDILGIRVNSRRGSAFSGGSMEEMTTFTNPGFRSSSPVNGAVASDLAIVGGHKGSPRARISLGAVPEESEHFLSEIAQISPVANAGESKQNLAYLDCDTESTDTYVVNSQDVCDSDIITNSNLVKLNSHTVVVDSGVENDSTSDSNGDLESKSHTVTTCSDSTDSIDSQDTSDIIT